MRIPPKYGLMALILVPCLSAAQLNTQVPEEPAPAPEIIVVPGQKLYLVEVIVFNNLGPIPAGGEIWHRAPRIDFDPGKFAVPELSMEPPVESSIPVSRPILPDTEPDAEQAPAEPEPIQFTQITHLAPHLSKLHTDARYEVVTYTAWVQPLFDRRDAIPVPIMREPEPSASSYTLYPPIRIPLGGSIQVFENRLLFVDVDVTNEFFDAFSGYSTSTRQDRPPGKYTLREKRRVKLNELHYFDHPFFGLLVRVSRYQPVEPPATEG